ncbi:MAG TPA: hypothetical protein VFI34_02570 [Candidatus Limnocylindrales bacterium]|nr:hypothetical protein [Candidatus Limnocylindrales bacterium]
MRRSTAGAALAVVLGLAVAGCGVAANTAPASVPQASAGPSARVGGATGTTFGAIQAALSGVAVQIGESNRPFQPPESGRLRAAPRAVYQAVLPDQPDAGFVVVYEFADAAAATDAGNEEAGYLGTGPARVEAPLGTQYVVRALGPTLIVFPWLPAASSDPTAGQIAAALATLGIGFDVPR